MDIDWYKRGKEVIKYISQFWSPHAGQQLVLDEILTHHKPLVYVECGRKFGKTEMSVFMCWYMAMLKPDSEVYYLAPEVKLARELVWPNFRMQSCNTGRREFPKEVADILGGEVKVYNQEMRITFPNGSFIKVDGSDNYDKQRGLKPDFVVADEYREFKQGWLEAYEPNMMVKNGTIFFITTPPHTRNHAFQQAHYCKLNEHGDAFYINRPSYTNDKIPGLSERLDRKKAQLIAEGREDEWRREYLAEFVEDSVSHIFPGISTDIIHNYPEKQAFFADITAKCGDIDPIIVVNPGNTTFLAAIAAIYDEYEAKLHILDVKTTDVSRESRASTVSQWIDEFAVDWNIPTSLLWDNTVVTGKNVSISDTYWSFLNRSCYTVSLRDISIEETIATIKEMGDKEAICIGSDAKDLILECQQVVRNENDKSLPVRYPPLVECLLALVNHIDYTPDERDIPRKPTYSEQELKTLLDPTPFWDRVEDIRASRYTKLEDIQYFDDYEKFY